MRSVNEIKRIYIEDGLQKSVLAENIRERASEHMQIEYISDVRQLMAQFAQQGDMASKSDLLLYSYPGEQFLSSCPGSNGMLCCQYFVLHLGQGCLFDCHYCYLQAFLNNPLMSVFGNLEQLFEKLDRKTRGKNFHFRIGTGEYTDSLALEPLTGLASCLVKYFAHHPNATLELKTKSSNVDGLLELDHRRRTVISWSMNPSVITDLIEEGTASLEEKLAAAKRAVAAQYKVAFHLDPLVYFDNWEREYHDVIDQIFTAVHPDDVAWISTGSLRYTAELKAMIQSRFPEDELTRRGEMIKGSDGKHRYFKTMRQNMFSSIKRKIESVDPKLFLYLCMESQHMWQSVFGFIPDSGKKLDALFEERRQYLADKMKRS